VSGKTGKKSKHKKKERLRNETPEWLEAIMCHGREVKDGLKHAQMVDLDVAAHERSFKGFSQAGEGETPD